MYVCVAGNGEMLGFFSVSTHTPLPVWPCRPNKQGRACISMSKVPFFSILGQRTHWFWSRSPFCSKLGHLFRIFRSPSYLGTMYFSLPFIPSNQLISAQMESTCFKGILTCALFLKSRDFRDIKNYIRERFPKKRGGKN